MTSMELADLWGGLAEVLSDYEEFITNLDPDTDPTPEQMDTWEGILGDITEFLLEPIINETIKNQAQYWALKAIADGGAQPIN